MEEKYQSPFDWHRALSIFALGIGAIGIINVSATAAAIPTQDDLTVAQVGIRSRINSPTPLNLRPRTHIPSPSRSYRRYDRGYGYHRHHHRRDRYDHHYQRNTYRRRRSHRGKVIIINPGNLRDFGSHNYIRVIGK